MRGSYGNDEGHSTEQVDLIFAMQLAGAIFLGSLIVQCLLALSGFAFKDDDSITFPFYLTSDRFKPSPSTLIAQC
ncbi:hypothetical protein NHN17_22260 [Photobacterium sp. ZSDE20]|uniref:Uncharacterized protein n=1 Tax=Photobacterium pectinilyticum TaxID=2906793 RepID=A0ABT1N7P1_9GAMM|nr:hypothetical protein [Photobacterium sp. ZSDE20]MCQ1060773.1 hypothetical protein [Photobacterium sp. ZSDE20]